MCQGITSKWQRNEERKLNSAYSMLNFKHKHYQ